MDLVDDLVVLEGEVLGNSSGLLEGEDEVEFLLGERQEAVSIMRAAGLDSKTVVVVRDESGGKGIRLMDVRNILQAEFFDQAVLECLVRAFYPTFGLWGVGTDDLNAQLKQSSSELGQAISRG